MARQVSGPCGALKGFPLGHGQVAAGRPVPTLCGGAWRQEELQHPLKGGDGPDAGRRHVWTLQWLHGGPSKFSILEKRFATGSYD